MMAIAAGLVAGLEAAVTLPGAKKDVVGGEFAAAFARESGSATSGARGRTGSGGVGAKKVDVAVGDAVKQAGKGAARGTAGKTRATAAAVARQAESSVIVQGGKTAIPVESPDEGAEAGEEGERAFVSAAFADQGGTEVTVLVADAPLRKEDLRVAQPVQAESQVVAGSVPDGWGKVGLPVKDGSQVRGGTVSEDVGSTKAFAGRVISGVDGSTGETKKVADVLGEGVQGIVSKNEAAVDGQPLAGAIVQGGLASAESESWVAQQGSANSQKQIGWTGDVASVEAHAVPLRSTDDGSSPVAGKALSPGRETTDVDFGTVAKLDPAASPVRQVDGTSGAADGVAQPPVSKALTEATLVRGQGWQRPQASTTHGSGPLKSVVQEDEVQAILAEATIADQTSAVRGGSGSDRKAVDILPRVANTEIQASSVQGTAPAFDGVGQAVAKAPVAPVVSWVTVQEAPSGALLTGVAGSAGDVKRHVGAAPETANDAHDAKAKKPADSVGTKEASQALTTVSPTAREALSQPAALPMPPASSLPLGVSPLPPVTSPPPLAAGGESGIAWKEPIEIAGQAGPASVDSASSGMKAAVPSVTNPGEELKPDGVRSIAAGGPQALPGKSTRTAKVTTGEGHGITPADATLPVPTAAIGDRAGATIAAPVAISVAATAPTASRVVDPVSTVTRTASAVSAPAAVQSGRQVEGQGQIDAILVGPATGSDVGAGAENFGVEVQAKTAPVGGKQEVQPVAEVAAGRAKERKGAVEALKVDDTPRVAGNGGAIAVDVAVAGTKAMSAAADHRSASVDPGQQIGGAVTAVGTAATQQMHPLQVVAANPTTAPTAPNTPSSALHGSLDATGTGSASAAAPAGDSLVSPMAHTTLQATPTVLEVGVPGGTHGWLKIRAEIGEGGAVQASVSATSHAGQETLRRELPALNAFLDSEHVPVSVQVAHGLSSGSGTAATTGSALDLGAGTAQNADPGTGRGQAQMGGELAAGGQGTSERGGRQPEQGFEGAPSTTAVNRVEQLEQETTWTGSSTYGGAAVRRGGSWLNVMA